jgi:hypothetical protein
MKESQYNPENNDANRGSEKRKLPEFIFVDVDRESEAQKTSGFEEQYFRSFQALKHKDSSISLRITCLLGALLLLVTLMFAIPFLLLFLLFNVLTFFKIQSFWAQTKKLWLYLKRALVMALGFSVAVFSPSFGVTLIMIYFLLQGQKMENHFMMKLMRSSMRK